MNDPLEIPDSIRKAAIALEIFFKVNGINEWALMGIQSRRSEPAPVETHNKCPECGGEFWMDDASVLERKLAAAESALAALKAELESEKYQSRCNAQAADNWRLECAKMEEVPNEHAALKLKRKLDVAKNCLEQLSYTCTCGKISKDVPPENHVWPCVLKRVSEALSRLNSEADTKGTSA